MYLTISRRTDLRGCLHFCGRDALTGQSIYNDFFVFTLRRRGRWGVLNILRDRSRVIIHPRILLLPGRNVRGFHR